MDYAQAILPSESTGMSPIEMETGHRPRMSYDWEERTREFNSPAEQLNREQAQQFVGRIHEALALARRHLEESQARMKQQADRHRRAEDFKVNDYVMLAKGKWQTDRPSDKLDYPVTGPWKIIAKKGHSYQLELPPTWKIHPVFPPDRLRRAPDDPAPGQQLDPEPPIEVDGTLEWSVEEILASRLTRGRLEYRAKWVGYDEDPVWYPARNFKNSPHLVQQFHERFPRAVGPPRRLAQWLKAYLEDLNEDDHGEDDLPEDTAKRGPTVSRRRRGR
jgi:hypothetical protein